MWDVVVERAGQAPVRVAESRTEAGAQLLAYDVCLRHREVGLKVSCVRRDSADQLQVTRRTGEALRDQPHLDPVGEALTIHVPTVHMRVSSDE